VLNAKHGRIHGKMMTHLDTNILIDLASQNSLMLPSITKMVNDGEKFACSAITWFEFTCGPCTPELVHMVQTFITDGILDLTEKQAETAAHLFNQTGRIRRSQGDCMIAAAAIASSAPISTLNAKDFQKFVPHGLKLKTIPTT